MHAVKRNFNQLRCEIFLSHKPHSGEHMFEVARYEPPHIFVRSLQTGETYKFQVEVDGALVNEGTHFDQGEPRRTAIAYLARRRQTKEAESQHLLSA
jgi:hypothetical protein